MDIRKDLSLFSNTLRIPLFILMITAGSITSFSQTLHSVGINGKAGLVARDLLLPDSTLLSFAGNRPLYTFLIDEKPYSSGDMEATLTEDTYTQVFENKVRVTFMDTGIVSAGWGRELVIQNIGTDTVSISNVVPFGSDSVSVNITGKGPWDLARAWLFRPGFRPVRVILPDNAWELGYTSFSVSGGHSVCALARRVKTEGGTRQRYATLLPPGAKVIYALYADLFSGEWQNGLRRMFRDRYLYDLDKFDNSLYERTDLAWIRESYLIVLYMAWDTQFFDRFTGKYTFPAALKQGIRQFGNIDVYAIWPTWPRLGLDPRNQWDLYRDLPGGTGQLRNFATLSRQSGTKFFIAYNPWDNSTRAEDHLKGMAGIISAVGADGVVLDTKGSSTRELQAAADSVREGVVMYSEGMAVVRDMPGIISGRVHNAIFMSPELNLNKLIKPDFAIFRVCDVGEDIIHREIAISFFNGYGTELNMYHPGGRDDNFRNDADFLSRTTMILRQNNDAFLDRDWTPFIHTTMDNVFVNRWKSGDKTIYTVLNMRPDGVYQKLFPVERKEGSHYVSLWNHEKITPVIDNGTAYLTVNADGWQTSWTGTRREGSVECIAEFPKLIRAELRGDSVSIAKPASGSILVWKGNPSYQAEHREFKLTGDTTVFVKDLFGYYEGKIVLQAIDNKRLLDEDIVIVKGGKPWLVNSFRRTSRATAIPSEMVLVPGAKFSYTVTHNDEFLQYPDVTGREVSVDTFLIDRYPVTNAQYYEFIISTGYRPVDTTRYLRNWEEGIYRQGQDKYPVVYVSYEDMKAYASWAGKRLPTEAEWQLAAQGPEKRKWPWGDEFHGTYCNNSFGRPTPVDAFAKGISPSGAADMVGNVWQMTGDLYFNGAYYFTIIRGGSYFRPESSWWYIQGGPQPLDKTQMLLMVSPGFDRSETVGFRCAMDIDTGSIRPKKQKQQDRE